ALIKKPNWITIDIAAYFLAVGIISIFGISLAPIPVIALMLVLAIYDAVSVYKTKHMLSLAESVMSINVPMLFVVPTSREFKEGKLNDDERKAVFLGVGDVVIPNILVASAQRFTQSPVFFGLKVAAWFALLGGVLGLLILLTRFAKKPQAGLPFLNLPTILGYLAGILF
ncbi:MAG: hypothetical protein DSY33_02205, partial [Archaeoglobus sp.]